MRTFWRRIWRTAANDLVATLLLSATLLVVVGSSFLAVRAVRRNQVMVARALGDFAYMGGSLYAYRTFSSLARFSETLQSRVQGAHPPSLDAALSTLSAAIDSVNRCACGLPGTIHTLGSGMRGDSHSVQLRTVPDLSREARTARTDAIGQFLARSPASRNGLALITSARSDQTWWLATFPVFAPDGRELGYLTFEPDEERFRSDVFAAVFEGRPLLLSPAVTQQNSNATIGSLRVTTASGAILYESSPSYASTFVGRPAFDGDSAIMVSLALSPAAAAGIMRGALPSTGPAIELALPLLAAILTISVALALYRARSLAHLRSQFAASVTHELRTPLTQILLHAETLQLGRAQGETNRNAIQNAIVREARRLVYLIENVLHFSRAERRLLTARPRVTRLDLVAAEHVEELYSIAEASGNRIEVEAPLPVTGMVDAEGLRLTLTNLIDNAIHYAPGTLVRVTVRESQGFAEVLVDDRGTGIPVKERERVLQAFQRLAGAEDRHPTGSGIGLTVVSEITRASGGALTLEDSPLDGLRVRLRFALAANPTD